jgi:hypothetical protein
MTHAMRQSDAVDFDAWLEAAWNDHGDRPQQVADRIAVFVPQLGEAAQIVPFARLTAHVLGEHLGQWQRGIDLIKSLRAIPVYDASPAASAALERNLRTLRYAGGEPTALDDLDSDDRIAVLAGASTALAGRRDFARANAMYGDALVLANAGAGPGATALRALAVGGNNLAAALEDATDRDAAQTQGMIVAAEGGLKYWRLAGTWLEEERALYRLARTYLAAGEPARAAQAAQHCVDVCSAHEAPALESFFAYATLALAERGSDAPRAFALARDVAQREFERVPPEDQHRCADDLAALAQAALWRQAT